MADNLLLEQIAGLRWLLGKAREGPSERVRLNRSRPEAKNERLHP